MTLRHKELLESENYKKIYTGVQGILMNKSHQLLESTDLKDKNSNILDIGSGEILHKSWMQNVGKYTISESSKVLSSDQVKIYRQDKINIHFFDQDPDYQDLPQKSFTRIILHHSLEHIPEPELFLKKIINLLSENGTLSISIPCDPGFLWRFGQILLRKKIYENFGWNKIEYDLIMSREHINPAQNLKKIINYYFVKPNWKFFPFPFLKFFEFNLIAYLHLSKKQLRKTENSL